MDQFNNGDKVGYKNDWIGFVAEVHYPSESCLILFSNVDKIDMNNINWADIDNMEWVKFSDIEKK